MSFEVFREANVMLAGLAFFWLGYRTVRAWPAHWAKPHHVTHYRALLVLLTGAYAIITLGSVQHEVNQSEASYVSLVVSVMTIGALLLCWHWPRPRPFRREGNEEHP